jgi:curved DNA-binding protein CbpA
LARKFHPDKFGGREAKKVFQRVNEAYRSLRSLERRRAYDLNLVARRRREGEGVLISDEFIRNLLRITKIAIFVFFVVFAGFLLILKRRKQKGEMRKRFRLYQHHVMTKRHYTPFNKFVIFVRPEFVKESSDLERLKLFFEAEKDKLSKIWAECQKNKVLIEELEAILRDDSTHQYYTSIKLEIGNLKRDIKCRELTTQIAKFKLALQQHSQQISYSSEFGWQVDNSGSILNPDSFFHQP